MLYKHCVAMHHSPGWGYSSVPRTTNTGPWLAEVRAGKCIFQKPVVRKNVQPGACNCQPAGWIERMITGSLADSQGPACCEDAELLPVTVA